MLIGPNLGSALNARIDQNTDGHEKERDEGITQREQPGQGFVPILGCADDEAGQKGTKSKGKADHLRDGGGPKADGQRDK